MKLSEVSTKDLKESLKALADLRRKYEGKRQRSKYAGALTGEPSEQCSLCQFNRILYNENCEFLYGGSDRHCPWFWFTNKSCGGNRYTEEDIPTRLKRVALWEAKIKAEIEGR